MLVHNYAINKLTPADYLVIKKEHKLLEKYLIDLRDACACCHLDKVPDEDFFDCQPCVHEKQASCQGRLPSFLFHITDLARKHFEHEETIMLSRPHVTEDYEYFRTHRQAHVDIMQKLQSLADKCLVLGNTGSIAKVYCHFYEEISSIFEQHDRLFDDPFIVSTKAVV